MHQSASLNSYPTSIAQEHRPLWLAFSRRKRVDPDACIEAKVQLWKSSFNYDVGDSTSFQGADARRDSPF
jgi:hypothetical protein